MQWYHSLAIIQSIKVVRCIFALGLTVSDTLTFKNCDLQKVGQGHSVILVMTPFDSKCKSLQKSFTHFCAGFYHFRDFFLNFWPSKLHIVQFSQRHHLMANAKIYKCLPHIFALASNASEIYKFEICEIQKIGYNLCNDATRWKMSKSTNVLYKNI